MSPATCRLWRRQARRTNCSVALHRGIQPWGRVRDAARVQTKLHPRLGWLCGRDTVSRAASGAATRAAVGAAQGGTRQDMTSRKRAGTAHLVRGRRDFVNRRSAVRVCPSAQKNLSRISTSQSSVMPCDPVVQQLCSNWGSGAALDPSPILAAQTGHNGFVWRGTSRRSWRLRSRTFSHPARGHHRPRGS